MEVKLTGHLKKIVTLKDNGYFVGAVECWDEDFDGEVTQKVVGHVGPGALREGEHYDFFGEWGYHPRYGRQFHFRSFLANTLDGHDAVVTYLKTCHEIGPVRSQEIWDLLGRDCLDRIREDHRCILAVGGITEDRAREIARDLESRKGSEQIVIGLLELFRGLDIPGGLIDSLKEQYPRNAVEAVRNNTFEVLLNLGVSFPVVDKVFLRLGGDPGDRTRFYHGCVWAFESGRDGSCWMPVRKLAGLLQKYLEGCDEHHGVASLKDRIYELVDLDRFFCRNANADNSGVDYVAPCREAQTEEYVAAKIATWLQSDPSQEDGYWPQRLVSTEKQEASAHQQEVYRQATRKRIGVIVGSPGTGKTYLIGRIVESLAGALESVVVCAPTNKAVLRIRETLKRQGCSAPVQTIHTLLKAAIDRNGDWVFGANETHRIEPSVVIVDEFSMVDLPLFASLLRALPDDARLLLIGDPDQLPSIGPGAVLRDLLESDVPHGRLTEIIRNDGAIVQACRDIREVRPIRNMSPAPEDETHNLCLLPVAQNLPQVSEAIRNIYRYECSLDRRESGKPPVRSEMDFQIILAINRKSPLSRVDLNLDLRPFFNPKSAELPVPRCGFYEGDKLICLWNGHLDSLPAGEARRLGLSGEAEDPQAKQDGTLRGVRVANGEIVQVLRLTQDYIVVQRDEEMLMIYVDEKARPKTSTSDLGLSHFDLALAITCHKSQGSSWPVVVVVLDSSWASQRVSDRHWLYTAISRAETRCYLVGDPGQIARLTDHSKMWTRKTFLVETMAELTRNFRGAGPATPLPKFTITPQSEQRKAIQAEPAGGPEAAEREEVTIPFAKPWIRPGLRNRQAVATPVKPSFDPEQVVDDLAEVALSDFCYLAGGTADSDLKEYEDYDFTTDEWDLLGLEEMENQS